MECIIIIIQLQLGVCRSMLYWGEMPKFRFLFVVVVWAIGAIQVLRNAFRLESGPPHSCNTNNFEPYTCNADLC